MTDQAAIQKAEQIVERDYKTRFDFVQCDDFRISGIESRRMIANLKQSMSKLVKSPTGRKMRKLRLRRAEGQLISWGEYFTSSGNQVASGVNPSEVDALTFDGDGYERGLSDYVNMVICVESLVNNMNKIDRDLAITLYQVMTDEAIDAWLLHYDSNKNAMGVRKHRLIKHISENINY